MGSDMGTPWGETIWDTLKENMHGDVDTFSWRPLLIIPREGYIQERVRRMNSSWQWIGMERHCTDGFHHHGTRSSSSRRKDESARQMPGAGHHLEGTQQRKNRKRKLRRSN